MSGIVGIFDLEGKPEIEAKVENVVQTNRSTTLGKGNWLVYVRNREGTPVFQKRIVVKDEERVPVLLTSR